MLQYENTAPGDNETNMTARDSRQRNEPTFTHTAPLVRCTYVRTGEAILLSRDMYESAAARGAVTILEAIDNE